MAEPKKNVIEIIPAVIPVAYNWGYVPENLELMKLYQKGQEAQWIPNQAIDWNRQVDPYAENLPDDPVFFSNSRIIKNMSERELGVVRQHRLSWTLSQFLHGEQGALLATASIVMCTLGFDSKYYAATQVMDEARHVFVYDKYLTEKLELAYPISPDLKTLLDEILKMKNWDARYLGMQILVEGIALSAFKTIQAFTKDREPLLHDVTHYVQQDEARHVAFGVLALRDFYNELSEPEVQERIEFIAWACHLLRERLVPYQVWERLGLPRKEMEELLKLSGQQQQFQALLFSTIVPNIKKLGLLNKKLRESFDKLGVLEYESWPSTIDMPA